MLEHIERQITQRYRQMRETVIKLDKIYCEFPIQQNKENLIEARSILKGLDISIGIIKTTKLMNDLPLQFKNTM
jgi:hypothetical protein